IRHGVLFLSQPDRPAPPGPGPSVSLFMSQHVADLSEHFVLDTARGAAQAFRPEPRARATGPSPSPHPDMPLVETNGIQMHYDEKGSGEPLLLIMGITATGDVWQAHSDCWSEEFRCIFPDNR